MISLKEKLDCVVGTSQCSSGVRGEHDTTLSGVNKARVWLYLQIRLY